MKWNVFLPVILTFALTIFALDYLFDHFDRVWSNTGANVLLITAYAGGWLARSLS